MRSTNKGRTFVIGTLAASAMLLAACGGGGGGGSAGVSYTGVTTAATIDGGTTAQELATSTISSAAINVSAIPVGVAGVPRGAASVRGVIDVAKRLAAAAPAQSLAGVQVTSSVTVQGCTGSATMSGSIDDTYTDIYGAPIIYNLSISFSNYLEDISFAQDRSACGTATLNGSMSFTASYDGPYNATPEMNGVSAVLSNLSVSEGGLSQTVNGSINVSLNTTTWTSSLSMTAVFKDTDGLVYKADNYTVDFDSSGRVTAISGRLYNPTYGYIDIATTTPLSYGMGCVVGVDAVPDAGVVTLTGDGSVTLDANTGDCLTYQVSWMSSGGASGSALVNW